MNLVILSACVSKSACLCVCGLRSLIIPKSGCLSSKNAFFLDTSDTLNLAQCSNQVDMGIGFDDV